MCLTLIGRLHMRLAGLIGPAALAAIFAAITGKPDYWTLVGLMFVVGVALDLGIYGWLIGYQPRWLTLVLAAFEFSMLKWIMEWPYPFEIRLRTRQALIFYVLAWSLAWLTWHVAIPWIWPRWAEDGGAFHPHGRGSTQAPRRGGLEARRGILLRATFIMTLVALAWLLAWRLTPDGYVFTGLLPGGEAHLGALASATRAERGLAEPFPANLIGWAARAGRWPVLPIYQAAWLASGWMWLLGAQLCCKNPAWFYLPILALPAILFSVPMLALVAACAWVLVLVRSPRFVLPKPARLMVGALLGAMAVGLAGNAIWTRPALYLDQGTWQALIWMRQHIAADIVVATSAEQRSIVAALGGVRATSTPSLATLMLTSGGTCAARNILFRHGDVCVIVLRSSGDSG